MRHCSDFGIGAAGTGTERSGVPVHHSEGGSRDINQEPVSFRHMLVLLGTFIHRVRDPQGEGRGSGPF